MPIFGPTSSERLNSVHPELQKVFREVVKSFDCTIIEGLRSPERQQQLVAEGKSKTLNSRHLTGDAVDVVPYPIDWADRERFHFFAGFVLGTAKSLGISLRWGGDWNQDTEVDDNTFDDLPHFERSPT